MANYFLIHSIALALNTWSPRIFGTFDSWNVKDLEPFLAKSELLRYPELLIVGILDPAWEPCRLLNS